jgi:hypothetical protein
MQDNILVVELAMLLVICSRLKLLLCKENEQLSKHGDTKSARNIMLLELKKLIEANPLFHDKLVFPSMKVSRLRTLVNQRFVICPLLVSCECLDHFL